ncbi:unnamed protein product [Pedinophyceae sp. YPF-701]|nr:unnamed protein product [Pedinophyceae sp. YPF-701]
MARSAAAAATADMPMDLSGALANLLLAAESESEHGVHDALQELKLNSRRDTDGGEGPLRGTASIGHPPSPSTLRSAASAAAAPVQRRSRFTSAGADLGNRVAAAGALQRTSAAPDLEHSGRASASRVLTASESGVQRAADARVAQPSSMGVGETKMGYVRVSSTPFTIRLGELEMIGELYKDMASYVKGFNGVHITKAVFRAYLREHCVKTATAKAVASASQQRTGDVRYTRRTERAREFLRGLDQGMFKQLDRNERDSVSLEDLLSVFYPKLPRSDLAVIARLAARVRADPPLDEGDVDALMSHFEAELMKSRLDSMGDEVPIFILLPRLQRKLDKRQSAFLSYVVEDVMKLDQRDTLEKEGLRAKLLGAVAAWRNFKMPEEAVKKIQDAAPERRGRSDSGQWVASMALRSRNPVEVLSQYSASRGATRQ